MSIEIRQEQKFKYVVEGQGQPLLLLHGLFGALSNFQDLIEHFRERYQVVMPMLPMFELPLRDVGVLAYMEYVRDFVEYMKYDKVHVLGNSLGGHIALMYIQQHPEKVKSLTLAGSSGLFENAFGNTFPKRSDPEFIRAKTAFTFYDPTMATDELVNEVFDIVNTREKAAAILFTAKSAIRHNMKDSLSDIKAPTLLIWGNQDNITPPFVGEEFNKLIAGSELHFIDLCGHAPMMERPEEFNVILEQFLTKVDAG